MSAAQARRRKQLLKKRQEQEAAAAGNNNNNGNDAGSDPVAARLQALLADPSADADTNYEALQLAQSLIRRHVKAGESTEAVTLAHDVSVDFLEKKRRAAAVSSQLLGQLADVLAETGGDVDVEETVRKVESLHKAYRAALASGYDESDDKDLEEVDRLHRVHHKFLNRVLKWSAEHGPILHGDVRLHAMLGEQCWDVGTRTDRDGGKDRPVSKEDEDEGAELRADAVTHLALAEDHAIIVRRLRSLSAPTRAQEKTGRGRAAERDCLLTRAVLVFASVENLADANALVRAYASDVLPEHRRPDMETLAKSYVDKKDGFAPTHVMFCNMLLRTCEKDRAGPLFQWLLRSFAADLESLPGKDAGAYTSKIGRVYFGIMPPPSMLNMMENMMGMMGGAGGAGGLPPGMAGNPMAAMMQQAAAAGRM